MNYLLIIAVLISTSSCNPFKKDNVEVEPESTTLSEAQEISNFYLSQEHLAVDSNGWIDDSCDSLFKTCMHVVAGGTSDIFLSRDSNGKYYRRVQRDCLENKIYNNEHAVEISQGKLSKKSPDSKSTISRDPILMCAVAWWETKNVEAVEDLIEFVEHNDNKLGDSDGSIDGNNRVKMTPTLKATLCEMRARLGGEDDKACRKVPQIWGPPTPVGTDAHLQVWHILLRGKMFKGVNDYTKSFLKKHVENQPNNAFFRAVLAKFTDGNMQDALDLLKPKYFPTDRLPSELDRCNENIWQHEMTPNNIEPCNTFNPKIFAGDDFTIIVKLAEGSL